MRAPGAITALEAATRRQFWLLGALALGSATAIAGAATLGGATSTAAGPIQIIYSICRSNPLSPAQAKLRQRRRWRAQQAAAAAQRAALQAP